MNDDPRETTSDVVIEASRPRVIVVISALLLAAVLLVQVWSVVTRVGREPHVDETENLHAGWLMRNGETLYETFFEHHSPFLFATLSAVAPVGEGVPARPYFVRARLLAGLAGLIAMAAFAFAIARAAPEAPALATALVFASGLLWLRSFAEVRGEAFALAFFWVGVALLLGRKGAGSGIGIVLVAVSLLWNPKWPVTSLAVGFLFIHHVRRDVRAWAAAILGIAVAFAVLASIVPLDVWWFFNFDVNLVLSRAVQSSQTALDRYFAGGQPFLFVPDAFHPTVMVPAALIVLAALIVKPERTRAWPLLLLAAAFADLRFVLPWPGIWSHYYLMWSLASAAVLAVVPVSVELLMRRAGMRETLARGTRIALVALGTVLVAAHVIAVGPVRGDSATYWVSERYLRERLQPGDVVWLEPGRHPVTVHDAHYYWYLAGQMVSAAEQLRRTERGRRYLPPTDDLPTCAPSPRLRFTLDPRRQDLVEAGRCFENLIEGGLARKTVFRDVWEMRLIKSGGKVVE